MKTLLWTEEMFVLFFIGFSAALYLSHWTWFCSRTVNRELTQTFTAAPWFISQAATPQNRAFCTPTTRPWFPPAIQSLPIEALKHCKLADCWSFCVLFCSTCSVVLKYSFMWQRCTKTGKLYRRQCCQNDLCSH